MAVNGHKENPQNEVDRRTKETHNSNKDKNTHRENILIRTRRTIRM
jgi:hypothetical protein